MQSIDPKALFIVLACLIVVSAFFSGAETAMMALNRYRLRHRARKGDRGAARVMKLLERPDRLLGIVLLGNQFANIFASSIATIICIHYFGDIGVIIATVALTFIILIFAETAPKTVAFLYPMRFAFPASWILKGLLFFFYPVVWVINMLANGILFCFGVRVNRGKFEPLSREELRTLVIEGGNSASASKYQQLLLRVLDLEKVTVEDVMVPRSDIHGIDLTDDWSIILNQLRNAEHAYMPIFEESIDQVKGVLRLRKLIEVRDEELTIEKLLHYANEVYFVPEVALLNRQLVNFQNEQEHFGLVVDEYGEIQGLVTLQDVLEEIVGEFSEDDDSLTKLVRPQRDGSYIVEGNINIRELNRITQWELSTDGPKTLSGLITNYLEMIPPASVACRIDGYPMEVIKANEHTIQLVQVWPKQRRVQSH
jgi:Mg2+/Co2+ transporter CorB